jgi:hypothetical protein
MSLAEEERWSSTSMSKSWSLAPEVWMSRYGSGRGDSSRVARAGDQESSVRVVGGGLDGRSHAAGWSGSAGQGLGRGTSAILLAEVNEVVQAASQAPGVDDRAESG